MRWNTRPPDYYNWHTWFAWYPVMIAANEWVWLETVARRRVEDTLFHTNFYIYGELE